MQTVEDQLTMRTTSNLPVTAARHTFGPTGLSGNSTGLKGRVHALANAISLATQEAALDAEIVGTLQERETAGTNFTKALLQEAKEYFDNDIMKMEEEFQVQVQMQRTENQRLYQHIATLKAEKTSIHQQILALQRRVEEVEEDVGHD